MSDDNWDRTIFDKKLRSIVEAKKLPVSASKIETLRNLAISHPEHRYYIIQCIVRFLEKEPQEFRLAGLYVIDAISRGIQKLIRDRKGENVEAKKYLDRFAIVLKDDTLNGCFETCSDKDKEKVKKTLSIWEQGDVYDKELVSYLKSSFFNLAPLNDEKDKQPALEEGVKPLSKEKSAEETFTPLPIDTKSLLASLSSLQSKGVLSNLLPINDPRKSTDSNDGNSNALTSTSNLSPALATFLKKLPSTSTAAPTIPTSVGDYKPKASSSVSFPAHPDPNVRPPANDPRLQSRTDLLRPASPPPPPAADHLKQWQMPQDRQGDERPSAQNQPMPQGGFIPPQGRPFAPQGRPIPPQGYPMPPQGRPMPPHGPSMMPVQYQQGGGRPPFVPWPNTHPPGMDPSMMMHRPMPPRTSHPPQNGGQFMRPPFPDTRGNNANPPMNLPGPEPDRDLPRGCIRVLTRTLFVGPLPDHYEKPDIVKMFSKYGELSSIILSRPPKGKSNGFLKFMTRAMVERAMKDAKNLAIDGKHVKVNWAFGFGPRNMFNYDRGESIIPLEELTNDEKESLVTAPIGGFQGQQVRGQCTIEEPEVQYKPEWKKDGHGGGGGGARWDDGPKRPMHNDRFHDDHSQSYNNNKKRRSDNGPDAWQPPPHALPFDPRNQGTAPPRPFPSYHNQN